ncbi:mandelate racemase/muconate lactonizing enzyme family protein [Acidianus brierleyi]|uniref:Mandelate racemase/muconate lactonizing enzyme family protein n=1 Tax=Acidianus brierleyi TaxID=41673 RepID=A0A2U9II71_9CREN|nr:mandelate racemase/muconate lactonizing enzyme family protein [Acidianus brierleyi]AWR95728.1 mandelate racemase/muconate lactonizing enzyme family protein [Acidianus brierleyi]
MELKISDIKVITVQANFQWTFVRIYSKDIYGTGEAGPAPGLKGMESDFKKLLLGEDAFKIKRIEDKMRYATLYSGTTTHHLIAGIINAIYDLIGKYLNIPVYKLLGGDRDVIRLYVDAHGGKGLEAMNSVLLPENPEFLKNANVEKNRLQSTNNPIHGRLSQEKWNEDYTPESYSQRAKQLIVEGYTAIKFDLDIPTPFSNEYNIRSGDLNNKDIDYIASIMKSVRETVGDDIDLMVDLHWRYNINTAIRLCKALEPLRLRWIEDPTPAQTSISNLEEFRLITSYCSTPIETGENMYSVYQFKDLIKEGIRVWAPDIAKTGIKEGIKIAELAEMYDIEFSPHNIGSPIATLANAHVCSASGTFGVLEFHGHDLPIWQQLIKGNLKMEKGFIILSDKPGLGIDLDENVIKKYWNIEL